MFGLIPLCFGIIKGYFAISFRIVSPVTNNITHSIVTVDHFQPKFGYVNAHKVWPFYTWYLIPVVLAFSAIAASLNTIYGDILHLFFIKEMAFYDKIL